MTCVREMRNECRVLMVKLKEMGHLEDIKEYVGL